MKRKINENHLTNRKKKICVFYQSTVCRVSLFYCKNKDLIKNVQPVLRGLTSTCSFKKNKQNKKKLLYKRLRMLKTDGACEVANQF